MNVGKPDAGDIEKGPVGVRALWVWRALWLGLACLLYLLLAARQLGLPGLHYDEAKEAGSNALELLTGAPVTAFREVAITLGGLRLPVMVQDYIGALNVYLALPFLALTGVGVPNLRALAVLTGLLTLLALERSVSEWMRCCRACMGCGGAAHVTGRTPISPAGLLAVTVLAASPSFVFWSRQGIFVTNLTQPLVLLCIWQSLRWLRTGRASTLALAALAAGLALYAKLVAIWIIAPLALMVGVFWGVRRRNGGVCAPKLTLGATVGAVAAFGVAVLPLILFNVQSGGTLLRVQGSAAESYYGVSNLALLNNLSVRAGQLWQVLRGDQFWYLGGLYANPVAPWLALAAVGLGLWRAWRCVLPGVILLLGAVLCSVFTISDLFITHYALLQPLMAGIVGIGAAQWLPGGAPGKPAPPRWAGWIIVAATGLWLVLDVSASLDYHRGLAQSGGLADHSDATYQLAYYLEHNGMGAPVALDWGIEAPVYYLTQGAVRPIELFGYAAMAAPDASFAPRLEGFLGNPDTVYLLHAPGQTVFAGRREAFMAAAQAHGLTPVLVESIRQRDGEELFELWRAVP